MPELSMLKSGHRYLFTKQIKNNPPIMFRANFIDIIENTVGSTLRVCKYYEDMEVHSLMVTMPVSWIIKVETLDEITNHKIVLPTDIVLMIDDYN